MNGDGELDLISGCYEGGLFLLKGLSDGEYDTPEPVLDKEGAYVRLGQYWCRENDVWTDTDLEHGISGVPIDWDDDGDLDLLLGASSGHVFRRMNEGSATEYSFATENVQVHAAGEPIGAPGGAMVITADWDRDGAWDILVGCANGAVVWYRNVGEPDAPLFDAAVLLVEAPKDRVITGEPTRPGTRVQIDVGDYNGDGLPDLLVGDYSTVKPEGPELTDEEKQLLAELREEQDAARDEFSALLEQAGEEEVEFEELMESNPQAADLSDTLENLRAQIGLLDPPSERHGWVWLYERRLAE